MGTDITIRRRRRRTTPTFFNRRPQKQAKRPNYEKMRTESTCVSNNPHADSACFAAWISAAQPNTPPHPLALPAFSNIPLSGIQKYKTFISGYIWKLAHGGEKWHNQRHQRFVRAFFRACKNYWCVRRCIRRWKERRMKERSSCEILLTSEPLHTIPEHMRIRIIDNGEKYTYYLRDLIRSMHTRLINSSYFVCDPLPPINPLTGSVLSIEMSTRIVLMAKANHIVLPITIESFWKNHFYMPAYFSQNYVLLHEMAIKNEAYSFDQELLVDIDEMYKMLNLTTLAPSLPDARRLNLVDLILRSHQSALYTFYLATKSLCTYTRDLALKGLKTECIKASESYHTQAKPKLLADLLNSDIFRPPPLAIHRLPVNRNLVLSFSSMGQAEDSESESELESCTDYEVDSP
jgi:hypothetical protein